MIRIPSWLFALLLPLSFLGGCTLSSGPVWRWQERSFIRDVDESATKTFPVLVRAADGRYAVGSFADSAATVVVSGLDAERINRDLHASIGSTGKYPYFQILAQTSDVIRVALEVPSLRDSKTKGWYEIRAGIVVPQQILRYGPGFAFLVIPWTTSCGLLAAVLFCVLVRRRPRAAGDAKA